MKEFIQTLKKLDALIEVFDEGISSSFVQEVVIKVKDNTRFMFKNGFEGRV